MKYKAGDKFRRGKDIIFVMSYYDNMYYVKVGCCKRGYVSEAELDTLEKIETI